MACLFVKSPFLIFPQFSHQMHTGGIKMWDWSTGCHTNSHFSFCLLVHQFHCGQQQRFEHLCVRLFFSLCGDVCSLSYYCEHARQNYIQSKLILVGGILVPFSQLTFLWLFRAGKIVYFRIYIYFFGNEMYIKNKQNDWTVLVLFQWAKKSEKIWY